MPSWHGPSLCLRGMANPMPSLHGFQVANRISMWHGFGLGLVDSSHVIERLYESEEFKVSSAQVEFGFGGALVLQCVRKPTLLSPRHRRGRHLCHCLSSASSAPFVFPAIKRCSFSRRSPPDHGEPSSRRLTSAGVDKPGASTSPVSGLRLLRKLRHRPSSTASAASTYWKSTSGRACRCLGMRRLTAGYAIQAAFSPRRADVVLPNAARRLAPCTIRLGHTA